MTPTADADQQALDYIRRRAQEIGCRLEVSSDPGDLPISASSMDRKLYGFGKTIEAAVVQLRHNPRKVP